MTKTLTALSVAAMCLTAVPAAAEMRLLLDDDVNTWVEAPAPSGIHLILDDDIRVIRRGVNEELTMNVPTGSADCSQVEASLGFQGAECGVTEKATLVRMLIDRHD